MRTNLTRKQAEVLDFIERQSRVPTIRELGRGLGFKSTNSVRDHLSMLVRKGRIVRDGMKSRGICVVVPLSSEEREGYGLGPIGRCPACGHVVGDTAVDRLADSYEQRADVLARLPPFGGDTVVSFQPRMEDLKMAIDLVRVREIREEVERQRKRWKEMLRGGVMVPTTVVVKGPVFRPHVSEEELEELLGLVEENRKLEALVLRLPRD